VSSVGIVFFGHSDFATINSMKLSETRRNSNFVNLLQALNCPVDASSLAVFRILFGLLAFGVVAHYFFSGNIRLYYLEPKLFFHYEWVPWIRPWPGNGMYVHFAVMAIAALGLAFGLFYRISASIFFLSYIYVFLIERAYYNNHEYLISLFAFLFVCTHAHRWASLDLWRNPRLKITATVPFWQIFLFKFQIVVVYFYGGLMKFNGDWLRGEPMRLWLHERAEAPVVGRFFETEFAAYFFSYGGLFFDLLMGWALLFRPTRYWAMGVGLLFNLFNYFFFNIGVFPFLMLSAYVLFMDAAWFKKVYQKLMTQRDALEPHAPVSDILAQRKSRLSFFVIAFITFYVLIQLLVPWRFIFYKDDVRWVEGSFPFGWRMMSVSKVVKMAMMRIDSVTYQTDSIDFRDDLSEFQAVRFVNSPSMVVEYSKYLRAKLAAQGIEKPLLNLYAWASFNGRPDQLFIKPEFVLADESFTPRTRMRWIEPLQMPASDRTIIVLTIFVMVAAGLAVLGLLACGWLAAVGENTIARILMLGFFVALLLLDVGGGKKHAGIFMLNGAVASVCLGIEILSIWRRSKKSERISWLDKSVLVLAGSLVLVLFMSTVLVFQP
jgi:hypothetical protein